MTRSSANSEGYRGGRRVGKSEDIAEAYLFLLKTGFSIGETIVVDGGALQVP